MFIKRKTVIIYDDRAEGDWHFEQEDVKEEILHSRHSRWHYLHYTIVKSERGGYITLPDMLNAMIDEPPLPPRPRETQSPQIPRELRFAREYGELCSSIRALFASGAVNIPN